MPSIELWEGSTPAKVTSFPVPPFVVDAATKACGPPPWWVNPVFKSNAGSGTFSFTKVDGPTNARLAVLANIAAGSSGIINVPGVYVSQFNTVSMDATDLAKYVVTFTPDSGPTPTSLNLEIPTYLDIAATWGGISAIIGGDVKVKNQLFPTLPGDLQGLSDPMTSPTDLFWSKPPVELKDDGTIWDNGQLAVPRVQSVGDGNSTIPIACGFRTFHPSGDVVDVGVGNNEFEGAVMAVHANTPSAGKTTVEVRWNNGYLFDAGDLITFLGPVNATSSNLSNVVVNNTVSSPSSMHPSMNDAYAFADKDWSFVVDDSTGNGGYVEFTPPCSHYSSTHFRFYF